MNDSGFVDLAHLAPLVVSGADAGAFLQNQLTCDVRLVGPTTSSYGALCSPKGRVAAFFNLFVRDGVFVMTLPVEMFSPVEQSLARVRFRSKVEFQDGAAEWNALGLLGREAEEFLTARIGAAPRRAGEVLPAGDVTIIRVPGRLPRFEVIGAAAVVERLRLELTASVAPADRALWDVAEIEAGVPSIHPATAEVFLPQFLNMDQRGGLSFTKGCFVGQEVVARTQHLGEVKRRMHVAHVAGDAAPAPGAPLRAIHEDGERDGGAVVRAAPAPEGGVLMLVVVPVAERQADRPIHLESGAGPRLTFREFSV